MKGRLKPLVSLMVAFVMFAALGLAPVFASSGTTDAISGNWYGRMHIDVANFVQPIAVSIPAGCATGVPCGTLYNLYTQCVWQLTFDSISGDVYSYHFSSTLKGGCPSGSSGTLTLNSNGTLYRVHQANGFIAFGTLYQNPTGK